MSEDLGSKASELFRKALTAGIGAVFLTEESLRSLVTEFKLPKEILAQILDSANKTRRDFFQNLSQDVISRVVDKVNVKDLVTEFLSQNDVELKVQVRFVPRDATPSVKASSKSES